MPISEDKDFNAHSFFEKKRNEFLELLIATVGQHRGNVSYSERR